MIHVGIAGLNVVVMPITERVLAASDSIYVAHDQSRHEI